MIINKGIFVALIISIFLTKWIKSENNNTKLKDALRNSTSTNFKNQNDDENNMDDESILKTEAKKMLKQCGGDSNESQDVDGFGTRNDENSFKRNRGNHLNNRKSNNNNYGNNRQGYGSSNHDGDWNDYGYNKQHEQGNRNYNTNQRWFNSNNRKQDNENNDSTQNRYYNGGGQYEQNGDNSQNDRYGSYDNYGSSYDRNSNGNEYGYYSNPNSQTNNRNNYDSPNSHNNNSYSSQTSGYGNRNYEQGSSQGGFDNRRGMQNGYSRNRQPNIVRGYQSSNSNKKNSYSPYYPYDGSSDRSSVCDENDRSGLGYIGGGSFGFTREQLRSRSKRDNYFNKDKKEQDDDNQLDNDRTPSESMIIKWLQEHVKGNDMDRIKALRDARRCFARLTTTDSEDGCDFSKELASCLDLDLE